MDFHELTFYLVLFKMLSCNLSYMLPDNFPKVVTVCTSDSYALCLDYHFRICFNCIFVGCSHSGNLSETQFTADNPFLMCSHAKGNTAN